jgi:hypothetical protein
MDLNNAALGRAVGRIMVGAQADDVDANYFHQITLTMVHNLARRGGNSGPSQAKH